MGISYAALCDKCGTKFTASDGGGFAFFLLHCDRCGEDRSVTFEELGG